ncbi:MAG: hypothetical protein ACTSYB_09445 [Candidatus Helarchaeota archaeon]
MEFKAEMLAILRHDLHKIRTKGALKHKAALQDELARRADGTAAWMSRNFLREKFRRHLYRTSLIFPMRNLTNSRTLANLHRVEAASLFQETDPFKLHAAILRSKLLNLYAEARRFPYTSLKYHILLTCALYYNFKSGFGLKDLYLCENHPSESPFQVIYRDAKMEWALLPQCQSEGLSKLYPKFYMTWERRKYQSIGGEHQTFAELLCTIGSWTVALATLEEFVAFLA